MATFGNSKKDNLNNFTKDFGKYPKMLISYIADPANTSIKMGEKGEYSIAIPSKVDDAIISELKANLDNEEEFKAILKREFNCEWGKIFKGPFSGYKDGLESKNKGNAFEVEFYNNYKTYAGVLAEALGDKSFYSPVSIEATGRNNTRRPLHMSKDGVLTLSGYDDHSKIGDDVADIKLKLASGEKVNLSLKCSDTVTFCNAGVSKIFTEESFERFETGEDESYGESVLPSDGIVPDDIFKLFMIDKTKFANAFIDYKNIT